MVIVIGGVVQLPLGSSACAAPQCEVGLRPVSAVSISALMTDTVIARHCGQSSIQGYAIRTSAGRRPWPCDGNASKKRKRKVGPG